MAYIPHDEVIVIEGKDDEYVWCPVELCEWCGCELPPIYDRDDDFECICGYTREVPSWLQERIEQDGYGPVERDSGGRLSWGPPGRYRPFPATSGFPYAYWRIDHADPVNETIPGVWHIFDKEKK